MTAPDGTLLSTLELFAGLDSEELVRVAALLSVHEHAAGAVIAREGELASVVYIIAAGRCRVSVGADAGGPGITLAELGPGECAGEMALIDMQPRSATLTAATDVRLLGLSNRAFLGLYGADLTTYTHVLLNVARTVSNRLRRANRTIALVARVLRDGSLD